MKKGMQNFFWGIVLVLCAFCLIGGQYDLFDGFGFWTLIGSILGGALCLDGIIRFSIGQTVAGAAVLLYIWKDSIGLEELSLWTILVAAILLGCGLSLIFAPVKRRIERRRKGKKIHENSFCAETKENHNSQVEIDRSFSGGSEYVRSDDFKSADIDISFSGLKVYFDDAIIQDKTADIHVDVAFAGLELYIPCEWQLHIDVEHFAGAVEEKKRPRDIIPNKDVYLRGEVSFGSVIIHYI